MNELMTYHFVRHQVQARYEDLAREAATATLLSATEERSTAPAPSLLAGLARLLPQRRSTEPCLTC